MFKFSINYKKFFSSYALKSLHCGLPSWLFSSCKMDPKKIQDLRLERSVVACMSRPHQKGLDPRSLSSEPEPECGPSGVQWHR